MSICFIWCSTAGFTMRNIAAWLSVHNGIGPWMGKPVSLLMYLSQAACLLVLANSPYSVSPTESATIFCCCNVQEIHLFAIRKMFPDMVWWLALFSPQSESEYPINLVFEFLSYVLLCLRDISAHVLHIWCVSPIDCYCIVIIMWPQMQCWILCQWQHKSMSQSSVGIMFWFQW